GSESTIQREEGFLEAIKSRSGIEVVSANQYGGADVEGAYKRSEALLSGLKRADGQLDVDGIFTPNESTTLAMLRVLEGNGWAGKVRFVGFDASDTLLKGMSDGALNALVLQDPVNMGYLGVKTIVAHIHGQPVEKRIDTGVRLVAREGEVCGLVGQNGAGKSTLMAILAGALKPDAGVMRLGGAPYAPRDPLDARQAGVAMIYQELSLAPHLTAMENIVLGVEPTRGPLAIVDRERMRRTAGAALAELGHADIASDAIVGNLPLAAQQLVEIARAIAFGCRVLVLDEPTSSLTHADVRKLFDRIGRLKRQGIAIVYNSHFIAAGTGASDRLVVRAGVGQ